MGESTKAILAFIAIAGVGLAVVGWGLDQPGTTIWTLRIASPIVSLAAGLAVTWLCLRRDRVPDFLRDMLGGYYSRDGFCFGFTSAAVAGVAVIDMGFQSQFSGRSEAEVALRPKRHFGRNAEAAVCRWRISCPPGGFGVARAALAVPATWQGTDQEFEIGASVTYPNGKGRQIRYGDGVFVRPDANFRDSFGTAMTVAALAGNSVVLSRPPTVTLFMPLEVPVTLAQSVEPVVDVLWQLGDPLRVPLRVRIQCAFPLRPSQQCRKVEAGSDGGQVNART